MAVVTATGQKRRVDMGVIKDFTAGGHYDGDRLVGAISDICDAVANRFYKHNIDDEEMLATARCRLLELLCEGKLDFKRGHSGCFSFLYTTARNMMANYVKKKDRRVIREIVSGEHIRLVVDSSSDSTEVSIWGADLKSAAQVIRARIDWLGMGSTYDRDCWRAAAFRAFEGQSTGSF